MRARGRPGEARETGENHLNNTANDNTTRSGARATQPARMIILSTGSTHIQRNANDNHEKGGEFNIYTHMQARPAFDARATC